MHSVTGKADDQAAVAGSHPNAVAGTEIPYQIASPDLQILKYSVFEIFIWEKETVVHAFGDGLESMVGWWSSCGCWHNTRPNCVPRPTNTEKRRNYEMLHKILIWEKEMVIHAVGDGLESMAGWIDDPPNCFPIPRNTAIKKNC
jgi:hypothetical protein